MQKILQNTEMLDDAELFSQLCCKEGIFVEPAIIETIKVSCSSGILQLAHTSITASLCEVIANVLSSSSTIKVIDLSDSMLVSRGLSYILKALCEGSSVTTLYLKGNNINGYLVEQLGEMLMHNNTIKIVHLEWNSLGSQVDSFAKFCEGLSKNHYLEELDMRYNQISAHCADALTRALRSNRSLKNLDLGWNSLGRNGGQKILQGIQQNRSLISLNLKGNCLSTEIYSAIGEQLIENQKRKMLSEAPTFAKERVCLQSTSSEENHENTKKKLQKKKKKRERSRTPLEDLRSSPLGNSGNDNCSSENKKSDMPFTRERSGGDFHTDILHFNDKIDALNTVLQERTFAIDLLKSELENKTAEFDLLKTENENLKTEIQQLKDEHGNTLEEKLKEVEHMKKSQMKAEDTWKESYKKLEDSYQNNLKAKQEIETKNSAFERELRKTTLDLQSSKEKFTSTLQNYEDTISECKLEVHRVKREMQEKENRSKIEINALKETLKETSVALQQCQEQLQKLRNELRESAENQAKLKMKAEEAERFAAKTARIEAALQKSKEDKEKLEEKLENSWKNTASLQKQIIKLQEESIEPQKRYEALRLELQIEKEKNISFKSEIQDERVRVKDQSEQLQKMLSQINSLYSQISDTQSCHAEVIQAKETEIEKLRNIVSQKSRDLDEYKSEQVQRAHQFQVAVNKYLESFHTNLAIT